MMKIRITLVQEITIIDPQDVWYDLDAVTDSLQDTFLDMQDVHQQTSDEKFTYETGPFTLKVEFT